MRLYLVRHGKTETAARLRFQSPDTPLSPRGVEELQACAASLRNVKIDAVYTSTYMRARMSADVLAATCGLQEPEAMELFVEKYNSHAVLGRSYFSVPFLELGLATIYGLVDPTYRWCGEETMRELDIRSQEARRFLEVSSAQYGGIMVVSHAFLIAMLVEVLCNRFGSPQGEVATVFQRVRDAYRYIRVILHGLFMKNAALYIFEYDTVRGGWRRI